MMPHKCKRPRQARRKRAFFKRTVRGQGIDISAPVASYGAAFTNEIYSKAFGKARTGGRGT